MVGGPQRIFVWIALLAALQAEGKTATCKGLRTVELATGCANTWQLPGRGDKNRDLIPVWRTKLGNHGVLPTSKYQNIVTRESCAKAQVVEYDDSNHVAKIICKGEKFPRWINLDSLSCGETPVSARLKREPDPTTCPADLEFRYLDDGSFDRMVSEQVTPIDYAVRYTLIARASRRYKDVQIQVEMENDLLVGRYVDKMQDPELMDRLWSANENIGKMVKDVTRPFPAGFGTACNEPPFANSDQARAQSSCKRLVRALEKSSHLLSDSVDQIEEEDSDREPSGMQRVRAELSDYRLSRMASIEDESIRMVLFYGLDENERTHLIRKNVLKFARYTEELGSARHWVELHDGYTLGGSRLGESSGGGIDCSEFVAGLLLPDSEDEEGVHKHRPVSRVGFPTTANFREIYDYLVENQKSGSSGRPPKLGGTWKNLYRCFKPVNLRKGEWPEPTDLLIGRNERLEDSGHIAVVDAFDPDTGIVHTVEASGGEMDSVRPWTRPLYEDACRGDTFGKDMNQDPGPPVRPDVFALRFIQDPDPACPLQLDSSE